MKKVLVLLALISFCWLIITPIKTSTVPVFLMTEEPKVLTKGYYGSVLIIELTFENDFLSTFIGHPLTEHALFLVDKDFLDRADPILKLLLEHKRQVGLIVNDANQLEPTIEMYVAAFNKQPLWVKFDSHDVPQAFQRVAFAKQLNIVAPTLTLQQPFPTKLAQGSFVSLPLDEQNNYSLQPIITWINQQSFTSIEESLFGYTTTIKKIP